MHSRDTGPALCNTHAPPKGPQPLPLNSVHSSPWPETPLLAISGASAHIRPKGSRVGRCRQPLFLSSGSLRNWTGYYTPPGVVWGPGKTGGTGAEAAGLAEADRMWGQWARPLQNQLGLTNLGSCVQKVGELLPKVRGALCARTCDHLVPQLPTLSKTQTQKTHISQEEETRIQNKNPSPWGCL